MSPEQVNDLQKEFINKEMSPNDNVEIMMDRTLPEDIY